jgi:large subunit ribosomal protein L5
MHRPGRFAGDYHRLAQALSALLKQTDNNIVRKIEKDMARLQEKYTAELHGQIQKKLGLENSMQVPKITKITLNMGVGEAVADKKVLDNAVADMEKIAGQKAVKTLARKSVAGFKIRDGYPIGCKVTLRRERMYEFLDRLVTIAIPRIRDFRGLNPKSFDKQGNYSMGVSEQIIFPEINYDEIDAIRGMDITISTTARNADEGRALLEAFNFPFKK